MTDLQQSSEKEKPRNNEIKDSSVSVIISSRFGDRVSWLGDLVIAAALIVVTLPVMGFVALAIRCESSGPVFYRQERVRLRGRPFLRWGSALGCMTVRRISGPSGLPSRTGN